LASPHTSELIPVEDEKEVVEHEHDGVNIGGNECGGRPQRESVDKMESGNEDNDDNEEMVFFYHSENDEKGENEI